MNKKILPRNDKEIVEMRFTKNDVEDLLADLRQVRKERFKLLTFLRELVNGDAHQYIKDYNIGYKARRLLKEIEGESE